MSTKDKCTSCMQLETGCLIYGIITCIGSGICIFFLIGALIYVNSIKDIPNHFARYAIDKDPESRRVIAQAVYVAINIWMGVCLVLMIIHFAFHVLLCDGANKRNAGKLKAYFIYGLTMQVLSIISSVVLLASPPDSTSIPLPILCTFDMLHILVLWMVYKTYKKLTFNSGYVYSQYQDFTQLINTNNVPYE